MYFHCFSCVYIPEGVGELWEVREGNRVDGTELEVGIPVDQLQLMVKELDVSQHVASHHKTARRKYTCTCAGVQMYFKGARVLLFGRGETVKALLLNFDQL